jgi:hypothetical protein
LIREKAVKNTFRVFRGRKENLCLNTTAMGGPGLGGASRSKEIGTDMDRRAHASCMLHVRHESSKKSDKQHMKKEYKKMVAALSQEGELRSNLCLASSVVVKLA